jgi:HAD superfamily hydrolase (TIGR01509 family)
MVEVEQLRALILDLDGLLIDSEIWSWQAHDAVLNSLGLASLSAEEIAGMVGLIGDDEWHAIRALRPVPDMRGQYGAAHTAAYLRIRAQQMAPMAGSNELLETASRLGLRVALASNSPIASAQSTLRSLGLLKHFAAIATGDQVASSKPAADVYHLALQLLDEQPDYVLAIEDSAVGLLAASAAGLRCLAVPNSVTAGQNFAAAYRVFASLHEVAAWLDGHEADERLA